MNNKSRAAAAIRVSDGSAAQELGGGSLRAAKGVADTVVRALKGPEHADCTNVQGNHADGSVPGSARLRLREEGDADVRAWFVNETERRKEAGCCHWCSRADAARLLGFGSAQEESGDAVGLGQMTTAASTRKRPLGPE